MSCCVLAHEIYGAPNVRATGAARRGARTSTRRSLARGDSLRARLHLHARAAATPAGTAPPYIERCVRGGGETNGWADLERGRGLARGDIGETNPTEATTASLPFLATVSAIDKVWATQATVSARVAMAAGMAARADARIRCTQDVVVIADMAV